MSTSIFSRARTHHVSLSLYHSRTVRNRAGHCTLSRDIRMRNELGDDLLDFIQAGPKLRKWYGETDKMLLPKDGMPGDDGSDDEDANGAGDGVVVAGADTELGQLIILQLVLARANVRVLVRDPVRTKQEFGPYVTPIQGDSSSGAALKKAMKGSRALIIAGPVGQAARAAKALGMEHIVLLSSAGDPGFSLGGLFSGADADLRKPGREEEVQACGVPYTIARFSRLTNSIGGMGYIEFTQAEVGEADAATAPGELSREDAALVAVRALQFPPAEGQGVVVVVGGAGRGVPPQGDDWADMFGRLKAQPVAQQAQA
eukprot:jgi/Ulvmu1/10881/UM007_0057.1